jgi:hypothetical protein
MRRTLAKIGALIILLVCIGSHVSELFDSWDNTLQTGNDIESNLVIVAVVVGAVLLSTTIARLLFRIGRLAFAPAALRVANLHSLSAKLNLLRHPPPLSLRI